MDGGVAGVGGGVVGGNEEGVPVKEAAAGERDPGGLGGGHNGGKIVPLNKLNRL